VTCATCHNGSPQPIASPVALLAPAVLPNEKAQAQDPTPTALFDRYVQAIGGEAALKKLTTRVIKATTTAPNGRETQIEIHEKAPDKYLEITTAQNGARKVAASGDTAWSGIRDRVQMTEGIDRDFLLRRAQYFQDLQLSDLLPDAKVGEKNRPSKQNVDGREAYLVQGNLGPDTEERLFFDAETGLLLRRVVLERTPLGFLPEQTDYKDYREVDGVKLPFQIIRYDRNRTTTLNVSSISHNGQLSDSDFEPTQTAAK